MNVHVYNNGKGQLDHKTSLSLSSTIASTYQSDMERSSKNRRGINWRLQIASSTS